MPEVYQRNPDVAIKNNYAYNEQKKGIKVSSMRFLDEKFSKSLAHAELEKAAETIEEMCQIEYTFAIF